MPPMMKFQITPKTHTMGRRIHILPRHNVPMSDRMMTPVGIEMSSVVNMNGPLSDGAQPVVNMWCAQTMIESPAMPAMPPITTLWPKRGFRAKTVAISSTAPTPGSRIT